MEAQVRLVAHVAGIPIVHVAPASIQLAGTPAAGLPMNGLPRDALVLEHAVGSLDVGDLEPLLHIGSYSTYFQEGSVGPAVRFARLGDNSPEMLLRTLEPGRRYAVSYGVLPDRPVLFRGPEMSAFALTLAERRRGVMAHGCGVVLPGGAVAACLGVSGAGKSTLARMLRSLRDCRVLNDDRIVLTDDGGVGRVWSTPWPGSAGIAESGDGPLGVIALIGRAGAPVVRRLAPQEALPRLLQTVLVPTWDGRAAVDSLSLLNALCETTPIVELAYPLGDGVPEAIRDLLSGVTGER